MTDNPQQYPAQPPEPSQRPEGGHLPPELPHPAEGGHVPPYVQQPTPYSAPPPPVYGPVQAVSPSEARMWSMFAHLGGTFLSFIVPLVIYLVYKDRDPFVRQHSAQALNFHITLFIAYVISFILVFVIIGIFTFIAAAICALVFTIMAAVAANDGREYRYPLTINFVS